MIWARIVAVHVVRHGRILGRVGKVEPHTFLMDFCLGVCQDGISIASLGYEVGEKISGSYKYNLGFGYMFEVPIRHLHGDIGK